MITAVKNPLGKTAANNPTTRDKANGLIPYKNLIKNIESLCPFVACNESVNESTELNHLPYPL